MPRAPTAPDGSTRSPAPLTHHRRLATRRAVPTPDGFPEFPLHCHTPPGEDVQAVIDLRAVLQQYHREIAIERTSALPRPTRGRLGLTDYEKMFSPDLRTTGRDIFGIR